MEELKKILTEATNVLRKSLPRDEDINKLTSNQMERFTLKHYNQVYNKALDDVIEQVINRIPN